MKAAHERARGPARETDLFPPVRDYLLAQGFTVQAEVKGCDITATRGDELLVVELKRSFCTALLLQATQRQRVTDAVYVALPRPRGRECFSARWRGIKHLLRRLELGLLLVCLDGSKPPVEVVFHPAPLQCRRSAPKKRAILQELAGRSGSYNHAGCTRRPLLTAYRESALYIACCLERYGPSSPAALRHWGASSKAQSIVARNPYGWFQRLEPGVYGLTARGRAALQEYAEVVERLRAGLPTSPRTE